VPILRTLQKFSSFIYFLSFDEMIEFSENNVNLQVKDLCLSSLARHRPKRNSYATTAQTALFSVPFSLSAGTPLRSTPRR
jgi:hypothetical protein